MAITAVAVGYKVQDSVKYAYRTDTKNDWGLVPNSTYFYNMSDKLVYHKDEQGEINVISVATDTTGYIDRETPIGIINGINRSFRLSYPPIEHSEHVYLNGILQDDGSELDYTISDEIVTFNEAPLEGSRIICSYRT